jgi:hypothetical protein
MAPQTAEIANVTAPRRGRNLAARHSREHPAAADVAALRSARRLAIWRASRVHVGNGAAGLAKPAVLVPAAPGNGAIWRVADIGRIWRVTDIGRIWRVAGLEEEELADWRAGRNAVYQLAALTIGTRLAVVEA